MRRLGVLVTLAAAVAVACETPTIPVSPREEDLPYDFRLRLPVGGDDTAGEDSLTFHWGLGAAVPVFVAESSDGARPSLAEGLARAAAVWNRAAVFREVRLRETAELGQARVLLSWSDGPDLIRVPEGCVGPTTTGAASTRGCVVEERDESGALLKRLAAWPRVDGGASEVRMVVTLSPRPETDAERARRLVGHEMGHALGILSHSPNPRDLMWSGLIPSDTLSPADRATLRTLYHARRDIVP